MGRTEAERIPDLNLFMMCERPDRSAFRSPPAGVRLRRCRPDELEVFLAMDLETPEAVAAHLPEMRAYFDAVYAPRGDLFFRRCLLATDERGAPIGRCLAWPAYGRFETIHWYKVRRAHEGRGIGRALLTACMEGLGPGDYPVYLHTHPSCYRAVKLYADFGFALLEDPRIGHRRNDLGASLPILEERMPAADWAKLRFARATPALLEAAASTERSEF